MPEFGDKMTPEIEKLLAKTDKPTPTVPRAGVGRKGLLLKGDWNEQR